MVWFVHSLIHINISIILKYREKIEINISIFSLYFIFVSKKNLKNYRRLVNVASLLDSTREPAYFRLNQSTSLSLTGSELFDFSNGVATTSLVPLTKRQTVQGHSM